ncbi:hypothetical protein SAY86_000032 [Trapa natans]|uniref:Uncharacterized protein n=1 Tax=Trapa natans TaxID=22666 RepID=A0AAN7RDN3_TRANT|nr:hypothetical protein SAY86_000032 [Trapa natans]
MLEINIGTFQPYPDVAYGEEFKFNGSTINNLQIHDYGSMMEQPLPLDFAPPALGSYLWHVMDSKDIDDDGCPKAANSARAVASSATAAEATVLDVVPYEDGGDGSRKHEPVHVVVVLLIVRDDATRDKHVVEPSACDFEGYILMLSQILISSLLTVNLPSNQSSDLKVPSKFPRNPSSMRGHFYRFSFGLVTISALTGRVEQWMWNHCVLAGRFIWAVRVDLHILDNGVRHFSNYRVRVPGGCLHCKRMWQLLEALSYVQTTPLSGCISWNSSIIILWQYRGWRTRGMSVNVKKFIEAALLLGLRNDGRNLYDYRKLTIKFGSTSWTWSLVGCCTWRESRASGCVLAGRYLHIVDKWG